MASYDDVDLLDMEYVPDEESYFYPCPCGDKFFITVDDLLDCEELAPCPSCSLLLKVIYDPEEFFNSVEGVESEADKYSQQQLHSNTSQGGEESEQADDANSIVESEQGGDDSNQAYDKRSVDCERKVDEIKSGVDAQSNIIIAKFSELQIETQVQGITDRLGDSDCSSEPNHPTDDSNSFATPITEST